MAKSTSSLVIGSHPGQSAWRARRSKSPSSFPITEFLSNRGKRAPESPVWSASRKARNRRSARYLFRKHNAKPLLRSTSKRQFFPGRSAIPSDDTESQKLGHFLSSNLCAWLIPLSKRVVACETAALGSQGSLGLTVTLYSTAIARFLPWGYGGLRWVPLPTRERENPKILLSAFPKPCYGASFGQKRSPSGRPSEAGMVDERAPALARRLNAHGRVLRRGRIFAWLREGWASDEIAAQERLTAERVRQIVRQALEKRIIDEGAEHAKLQLARLQPAMRLAGEAIAEGDVTAIAPLMKVLDRLDRYQRAAKAVQVYDDEARRKLMDKINRVAANLGVDEAKAAAKAAEAAEGAPPGGEAAALADARADAGEA